MSFVDLREALAMGSAITAARGLGLLAPGEVLPGPDEPPTAASLFVALRFRRLVDGPLLGNTPTMAEQGDAIRAERKRKKDERAAANAAARASVMGPWR